MTNHLEKGTDEKPQKVANTHHGGFLLFIVYQWGGKDILWSHTHAFKIEGRSAISPAAALNVTM